MNKRITLSELEIEVVYKMVRNQIEHPPFDEFHKLVSMDIFRKLEDKLEAARIKEEENEN